MRIEQLQVYRQNGITTLAEGALFETAKKRRLEEVRRSRSRHTLRMWSWGAIIVSLCGGCVDFDVVVLVLVLVAGVPPGFDFLRILLSRPACFPPSKASFVPMLCTCV